MDPVSASNSIEAVNNIMQFANQATIQAAEKLMKVTVETAVGVESGKGGSVDVSG